MGDGAKFVNHPSAALERRRMAETSGGSPRAVRMPQRRRNARKRPEGFEALDAALSLEVAARRADDGKRTRPSSFSPFSLADHPAFQCARKAAPPLAKATSERAVQTSEASGDPVLQETEDDAFSRSMRGVLPLKGKGRAVSPPVSSAMACRSAGMRMRDVPDGAEEFAVAVAGEHFEGHVAGLDALVMNTLRAGGYGPEARLDLHGLNAAQAFHALVGFFRSAWCKGLRTVLVAPGRGRNSPNGIGVLRAKLQWWLTQEPFKRVVLAFCTARPADGGPGSVYVLLRNMRKKDKICWERMPADSDLF